MAEGVDFKDLTNNGLVRDIRRAAALALSLSGRPASSLYSPTVVFDYTQYGCDIQEQVDTKITKNSMNMRSSHMGLVGIWG